MIQTSVLAYLRDHWTGNLGLAWSFWVNLVGVRVVISLTQAAVVSSRNQDDAALQYPLVALWIFAHAIVLIWQIAGVLRASERHLKQMGSISSTWGAQLGILIAVFFALIDMWGVWLTTRPGKDALNFAEKMTLEHASKYELTLSDDKRTAHFSGDIAPGSANALRALLAANPGVETLSLTSLGGNIYEARGIANLAGELGIDTLVEDMCSSACTLAFIGGVSRSLAHDARLGFHQYRVDATYAVLLANPEAEQARDAQLYRQSGVAEWFVTMMFHKRPEEIWYPSIDQLQKAGVLVVRDN